MLLVIAADGLVAVAPFSAVACLLRACSRLPSLFGSVLSTLFSRLRFCSRDITVPEYLSDGVRV